MIDILKMFLKSAYVYSDLAFMNRFWTLKDISKIFAHFFQYKEFDEDFLFSNVASINQHKMKI